MKVKVIGPKDAPVVGVLVINTTSRSKNWSRGLSPFFIGPCHLYQGYISINMENAWQYSKVYPEFVDENDDPNPEYFKWAQQGWSKKWADRYPMGKGAISLYSYWDGERLGYIEARKRIYVPLYSRAVRNTEAYRKLKELYQQNPIVYLWDFDGYDYEALNMSLKDVINCPSRKMGHAFVLAKMLESDI